MSTAPLTCAQVAALPDESWLNQGFQAHVLKIDTVPKKAGGNFWKATLGDAPGDYTHGVTMSLFMAPRFAVGDTIRVTGKGIGKKSYQGKPQVGMGKESVCEVIPSSAKVQQVVREHIAEVKGNQAQASAEGMINGQAVGNAMTNAFENMRHMYPDAEQFKSHVTSPAFWTEVWTLASDHLRIARMLEQGRLCDPVKQRSAPSSQARGYAQHNPDRELDTEEPPPF